MQNNLNDICASYQAHLVNVVLKNAIRVLKDKNLRQLAIAGGVSANSELRRRIGELEGEMTIQTFLPEFQYCTDNAAMIGIAAYYKYLKAEFSGLGLAPLVKMPL